MKIVCFDSKTNSIVLGTPHLFHDGVHTDIEHGLPIADWNKPMELYTEKLSDKTIYYPYNETCDVYGPPRAGKRAQQYCDEKNQYKGGHYVLHTKKQYDEWYEKKGQHLEALGINSGWDY